MSADATMETSATKTPLKAPRVVCTSMASPPRLASAPTDARSAAGASMMAPARAGPGRRPIPCQPKRTTGYHRANRCLHQYRGGAAGVAARAEQGHDGRSRQGPGRPHRPHLGEPVPRGILRGRRRMVRARRRQLEPHVPERGADRARLRPGRGRHPLRRLRGHARVHPGRRPSPCRAPGPGRYARGRADPCIAPPRRP